MSANQNRMSVPSQLMIFCSIFLVSAAVVSVAMPASVLSRQGSPDEDASSCNLVALLIQQFDTVVPPALPPGWSSTTWVTSNSGLPQPPFASPPNAAYVDDREVTSDKRLLSPNISLVSGGEHIQVSFDNNFNTQDGFDGGVLEVSFDNGLSFQDVIAAGGIFMNGGYTGTISTCCGNPLGGRQAWTGDSRGFIVTSLILRVPAANNMMMLRWRMGTDSSIAGQGWRIDVVVVTECAPTPTPAPFPTPRVRPTPAPRPSPSSINKERRF